jgi:hypothetical protein
MQDIYPEKLSYCEWKQKVRNNHKNINKAAETPDEDVMIKRTFPISLS